MTEIKNLEYIFLHDINPKMAKLIYFILRVYLRTVQLFNWIFEIHYFV